MTHLSSFAKTAGAGAGQLADSAGWSLVKSITNLPELVVAGMLPRLGKQHMALRKWHLHIVDLAVLVTATVSSPHHHESKRHATQALALHMTVGKGIAYKGLFWIAVGTLRIIQHGSLS